MNAIKGIGVIGLLAGCAQPEAPPDPILRSVRYVVAASDSGARHQTFSGVIRAGNQSRLSFQVPGRVNAVRVKVGDKVRANQPIASLDPADFKLQLQEAQASASQASAQARSAASDYERVRKLYTSQNASRQELDNARAQRDSAKSAAAAAFQAVRRLQRQLGYATLTAPGAGTISEVQIEASEVVSAGQVVAVLQVGEQLEVLVDVPESTINRVSVGHTAEVRLDALKGRTFPSTVFEVGIETQGGAMFPVTLRLPEKTAGVRAGMAADVIFSFDSTEGETPGHVLPTTAVGEDRQGRFVFAVEDVADGKGTVRRTPVEVGNIETRGIRILSGVTDGMLIVTAGVARIHDGLTVLVPPKAGQAGGAP